MHHAKSEGALGNVLEFMRLIWAISHGLQATSKRMEAEHGVTGPQRLVVRILGRLPNASAGQLAGILHVHPSTLTGILRRLEDRDVIVRRSDEQDARRIRLRLTAKGREIDNLSAGTVEAAVTKVLRAAPAAKVKAAEDLLAALAIALNGDAAARSERSATEVRRSARMRNPTVVRSRKSIATVGA